MFHQTEWFTLKHFLTQTMQPCKSGIYNLNGSRYFRPDRSNKEIFFNVASIQQYQTSLDWESMRHFLCLDPDKVAVEDDGMVATADGDQIRRTLPDFRNPSQPW